MPETEKFIAKVFIEGSIDDVWREITKTDEMQGAMFNMRLHTDGLRLGGHIRMRTADGKYTGVVGEVLEIDPPHRYVTTFKFTNYNDPLCKVTHELREVEGGVEYTLTSEDIVAGTKTASQMRQGGAFITKTLKGLIENGKPPLGSRMILLLIGATAFLSPKICRSENWPLEKKIE